MAVRVARQIKGVKSVDAARATLEKAGVKFDGETREYPGMVRLATFFDPDGNVLELVEDPRRG